MTLTLREINRYFPSVSSGAREAIIVDVAFDYVLAVMARSDLFNVCGLTFKGGTAARKFRLDSSARLSFDLDFDGAVGAAEVVAEELDGAALGGFEFSMELPTVPVMTVDESVAEKMSRWQNEPLIRDLCDLVALRRHIRSPSDVSKMWILKSHQAMTEPRSRHPRGEPAAAAKKLFVQHDVVIFDLDSLVFPRPVDEEAKREMVRSWVTQMPTLYAFALVARDAALGELADDTGKLAWKARRIVQEFRDTVSADPWAAAASAPQGDGVPASGDTKRVGASFDD